MHFNAIQARDYKKKTLEQDPEDRNRQKKKRKKIRCERVFITKLAGLKQCFELGVKEETILRLSFLSMTFYALWHQNPEIELLMNGANVLQVTSIRVQKYHFGEFN